VVEDDDGAEVFAVGIGIVRSTRTSGIGVLLKRLDDATGIAGIAVCL